MCPADAKQFPSFAHAQVTVTNEIYSHMDKPETFLFCPTGGLLGGREGGREGGGVEGGREGRREGERDNWGGI